MEVLYNSETIKSLKAKLKADGIKGYSGKNKPALFEMVYGSAPDTIISKKSTTKNVNYIRLQVIKVSGKYPAVEKWLTNKYCKFGKINNYLTIDIASMANDFVAKAHEVIKNIKNVTDEEFFAIMDFLQISKLSEISQTEVEEFLEAVQNDMASSD